MRGFGGDGIRERLYLFALWVVLVAALLPIREVTPPDEPRFTHQAEEMKEDGEWAVPKIGGLPNADKPPGLFWAINLASLPLSRVNELTARVPSALAALCVLLLTARLGRRLFGSQSVGVGAGMILLTGIEFFQKAEWVSCDMLMTAFAFLALTLWRETLFEESWRFGLLLGWAAAALAVLTKGPVGLLWPIFWIVSEAAARKRFRPVLRIAQPVGIAIFFLAVGGWLYAFGAQAGGGYVQEAVFKQNLTRYVSAWNSVHPWYFYFGQLPLDLLPWSLMLPAVAALVAETVRGRALQDRTAVAVRATTLFSLLGFAFFSGSSGKRGVYLLPIFPAVALLVCGAFVSSARPGSIRPALRNAGLWAIAALGALLAAAPLLGLAGGQGRLRALASELTGLEIALLVLGGVALAAGAVAALLLIRKGRAGAALHAAVAGAAILLFVIGTVGGTAWSRHQAGRAFGRRIASLVPPRERIVVERGKFELILFYSDRRGAEVESEAQLAEVLRSGACSHAILEASRYEELRDRSPLREMKLLDTARLAGHAFVLLASAPR